MILGQSAATAAVQALETNVALQEIPFAELRHRLLGDGQVLDLPPQIPGKEVISKASLKGIVLDDSDAILKGTWSHSTSTGRFVGVAYIHDSDVEKGEKSVTWKLKAPEKGRFELRLSYTANPNRATNVPVIVSVNGRSQTHIINQQKSGEIDDVFHSLGTLDLKRDDALSIEVSNKATDGHVIVDAIQFLPVPLK